MAQSQALEVQQKKEMTSKEEQTVPSRYFVPNTDIFETEEALVVVMEIPGVDKNAVEVRLENDSCGSKGASTTATTRSWNRSTPSTMSGTLRAGSRCPTRSIRGRSAPS